MIDQVLAIITLPIGKAGTRDGATETVGLRDCPHRHEPAVTPAGHAQTRRVDRVPCDRGVDSGENVSKIAAAEIFHIGASEIFSLSVAAARIWQKDVVTA